MNKTLSALGLALTGILFTQANASAQIASTTYGGHTYELFDAGSISWGDAEADAVADGGYLAVLTTAAETTSVYDGLIGNGFFTANDGAQYQAWLGATPADGSNSTTDPNNWAWVTGETWTAFDVNNFAAGEPNGDSDGLAINRYGNSEWNDQGGSVEGYIEEKNSVPDSGSTLVLLGGAFTVLGAFGRKLRKP